MLWFSCKISVYLRDSSRLLFQTIFFYHHWSLASCFRSFCLRSIPHLYPARSPEPRMTRWHGTRTAKRFEAQALATARAAMGVSEGMGKLSITYGFTGRNFNQCLPDFFLKYRSADIQRNPWGSDFPEGVIPRKAMNPPSSFHWKSQRIALWNFCG